MIVLLLGASGFIGKAVVQRLVLAGHRPILAGRDVQSLARGFPGLEIRHLDFSVLTSPKDWMPELAGVDAVINCVGVFSASDALCERLHATVPEALAKACLAARVRKILHISALGADPHGATAYWRSKGKGEQAIAALDPEGETLAWAILRPSLVYGPGGQSAAFFSALALSPLQPKFSDAGSVQPLAVRDLADAILSLLERSGPMALRLNAVGPEPMPMDEMLDGYRRWMGLGKALRLPMPRSALSWAGKIGDWTKSAFVNKDSMTMLRQGSHSHSGQFRKEAASQLRPLLGGLTAQQDGTEARRQAWLFWSAPILRMSLAILWLVTALVSAFVYPETASLVLLAQAGLEAESVGRVFLYGSALLDGVIGVLLLIGWRPVLVGTASLALMAVFTLILSIAPDLRDFWSHPFGPVLKNIPIAAATFAMIGLYDGRTPHKKR